MNYEIKRAYNGGPLTPTQRSSSLFSEEPVVLGKVLRRGSTSIFVPVEQFELNKVSLQRLEKAGSIVIIPPAAPEVAGDGKKEESQEQELSPNKGEELTEPTANEPATELPPVSPAVDPVGEPVPVEPVVAAEVAPAPEVVEAPVEDTIRRRKKRE